MKPVFFQHATALVETTAIGRGTRIWAFAHILAGVRIGERCNIADHCFIEAGARIGDNVTVKNGVMIWDGVSIRDNAFIGPGVVFTNDLAPRSPRFARVAARYASKGWLSRTVVETGASLGANATILCGLRIGRFAMVAAGAVVTKSVPAHALVAGVPARQTGWVCECGARLAVRAGRTATCAKCRLDYRIRNNRLVHGH